MPQSIQDDNYHLLIQSVQDAYRLLTAEATRRKLTDTELQVLTLHTDLLALLTSPKDAEEGWLTTQAFHVSLEQRLNQTLGGL